MTDTSSLAGSPTTLTGRGTLWAISAGHGVADAYTAFLPALLPLIALHFGMTEALLAALVAVFALASSLPGPALGRVADRLGHGRVAALSVALSAATLSLLAVAPSVEALFALVAVAGLGSAALHPSGSALARVGGAHPDTAIATFSAGGMLGYAVGPLAATATLAIAGPDALPWLAIPGLLVAASLFVLLPQDAVRPLAGTATRRADTHLLSARMVALTVAGALAFLPFTAAVNGLPIWLGTDLGLAPGDRWIALTITLFSLAGAFGGVVLGLATRVVARRRVLVAALVLGTMPLQTILFLEPGGVAYASALVLAGALVYAATPLLVATVQELAPRAAAAAAGMVFGLSAGAAAVLYLGIGVAQQVIGVEAGLRIAFTTPLLAAAIAWLALEGVDAAPADDRESLTRTLCRCLTAGPGGSASEACCAVPTKGGCTCD